MVPRRRALLAVTLVLCLAVGAGLALATVTGDDERPMVQDCAATPPADHADPADADTAAVTGWVDGYWYDEPVDVDVEDGLTEGELERLSARTAARIEALRCLRFEEVPPVEVLSREEFAAETGEAFADVEDRARLVDNAQFATLLLAGEDEDAVELRESTRSATVGGFYNFETGRIAVVSDDPDRLLIDEEVLAHELGHALQDQHFDLGRYDRPTTDADNAILGVIEGDVHFVEQRYFQRCDRERWTEPCLTEGFGEEGDGNLEDEGAEPPNWGLYFMQYQPYSDGPAFVEHVYEEGGWEAVNDLYEDMPTTALHVIDPETYGDVVPENLTVADRSATDWERITDPDGPNYNEIGQAGISAILMGASYDDPPGHVVDPQDFLNLAGPNQVDETDPLNYDLDATDGWRGDRLYVYRDGANRSGTVWHLAFADAEESRQFADAYGELAEHRGGEPVEAHGHTYDFGADSDFDMATALSVQDDRVWIVTAPDVESLSDVHEPVADWEVADGPASTPSPADGDERGSDAGADERATDDVGSGFGAAAVAAAVAALALALVATRR